MIETVRNWPNEVKGDRREQFVIGLLGLLLPDVLATTNPSGRVPRVEGRSIALC